MVQFIIKFDRPVRFGQQITDCVGPFTTIAAATQWLAGPFAIELPRAELLSILKATS